MDNPLFVEVQGVGVESEGLRGEHLEVVEGHLEPRPQEGNSFYSVNPRTKDYACLLTL